MIHTHYIGVEFNGLMKGKEHDNAQQICQDSRYRLKASMSMQTDERRRRRTVFAFLSPRQLTLASRLHCDGRITYAEPRTSVEVGKSLQLATARKHREERNVTTSGCVSVVRRHERVKDVSDPVQTRNRVASRVFARARSRLGSRTLRATRVLFEWKLKSSCETQTRRCDAMPRDSCDWWLLKREMRNPRCNEGLEAGGRSGMTGH